jgi:hypothetical protein
MTQNDRIAERLETWGQEHDSDTARQLAVQARQPDRIARPEARQVRTSSEIDRLLEELYRRTQR